MNIHSQTGSERKRTAYLAPLLKHILTGGRNLTGHPVIHFPNEAFPKLQQCTTGDLLLLLKYYVKIAGPKVAILIDMQARWTESDIIKVITSFDELQAERRGTITHAYIIQPGEKTELRELKRCLLRKSSTGRILPFYKVSILDTPGDIFNHIDRDQLTADFGGTLEYDHYAWVEFQRTFALMLSSVNSLRNKIPVVKKHTMKLREHGSNFSVSCNFIERQKEAKAKYQSIFETHCVRETLSKCKDAVQRLDNTDQDTILKYVNSHLVIEMKNKLKDVFDYISVEVNEMDDTMAAFEDEMAILAKLKECKNNTDEVKETINLLSSRIPETAVVGKDISEATNFRAYFIATALEPSKDIVACATSILKNLDGGSKTTQRTYNLAFDIAKQLTQSIQPFTRLINALNEDYTKIHVFHAVLEKMVFWKSKASVFIIKQLSTSLNDKAIHSVIETGDSVSTDGRNNASTTTKTVTFRKAVEDCEFYEYATDDRKANERNNDLVPHFTLTGNVQIEESNNDSLQPCLSETIDTNNSNSNHIIKLDKVLEEEKAPESNTLAEYQDTDGHKDIEEQKEENVEYNTNHSILLNRPESWRTHLQRFYRKHPPPKKKHAKLLTKYDLVKCHRKLRDKADVVAERTLFIISFLRKKLFKMEDIIRIQQWEMEDCLLSDANKGNLNSDACILEVTLV